MSQSLGGNRCAIRWLTVSNSIFWSVSFYSTLLTYFLILRGGYGFSLSMRVGARQSGLHGIKVAYRFWYSTQCTVLHPR